MLVDNKLTVLAVSDFSLRFIPIYALLQESYSFNGWLG